MVLTMLLSFLSETTSCICNIGAYKCLSFILIVTVDLKYLYFVLFVLFSMQFYLFIDFAYKFLNSCNIISLMKGYMIFSIVYCLKKLVNNNIYYSFCCCYEGVNIRTQNVHLVSNLGLLKLITPRLP